VLICCKDFMVCFRLVPEFFMCLIFLGAVDSFFLFLNEGHGLCVV
jgi:hypothetical protein